MTEFLERIYKLVSAARDDARDDAALYTLLAPFLDGTHRMDEVMKQLSGRASASDVGELIEQLLARGRLIELPPPMAGALPQSSSTLSAPTATLDSLEHTLSSSLLLRSQPLDPEAPMMPDGSAPPIQLTANEEAEPLAIPEHLGPYRIERRIGKGGMGVVYAAWDQERNRQVALKTLLRFAPQRLSEFKNEFRRVSGMMHPNLATPYELMVADGVFFFTMELVDGVSFTRHVRGPGSSSVRTPSPLTHEAEERLRPALQQLVGAIEALHAARILHMDLKPSNVMVDRAGRVVVLDFGLSRELDPDPSAPVERARLQGTPSYLAPEQVLGHDPRPATDWYSVGLMLFEALTGVRPFHGSSITEMLHARVLSDAPPPSSLCPEVPGDLEALCIDLLARDPTARPRGAEILQRVGRTSRPVLQAASDHARQIIGREREVGALLAAYDAVCAGGSRFIHVQGLSGVGKSAVVHAVLDRIQQRGNVTILAGRCYEWESLPYKGFDAAIDALCLHLRAMRDELQRSIIGADGHEAALLFPVLLSLPVVAEQPAPPEKSADPIEQRRHALRALKRLLARLCAQSPLVLFLDDLQWGDVDGVRLLAELLSAPTPPGLLVLASSRTDEAHDSAFLRELEALRVMGGLGLAEQVVELLPLGHGDACRLAESVLEDVASPALVERIARESGGSPFFLEQLARHAIHLGADAAPQVSLTDVIDARLALLPDEVRRVFQVIAVAGQLPGQELASAVARVRIDTREALSILRAASLVRTRGPRKSDPVEVYHDRLRECMIAQLSPETLQELHGELARVLEQHGGVDPDVLATHFHGAGDDVRASHHAAQAADEACAALAFHRAATLYRKALAWHPHSPDAQRLTVDLAHALFNSGQCTEAGAIYLRAAATATGADERDLRSQAARAYFASSRLEEGIQVVKPLLRTLGINYPATPHAALLSILAQLARLQVRGIEFTPRRAETIPAELLAPADLCWTVGNGLSIVHMLVGIDFCLRSLFLALRAGEARRVGRALGLLGSGLATTSGWIARRGEQYLSRAEALGHELDDPYLRGFSSIVRAIAEAGGGRWHLVLEQAERGVDTLTQRCTGVSWECDMGVSVALKALECMGSLHELGPRAVAWSREAAERGNMFAQMAANSYIGLSLLASGDVAGARTQAARGMQEWSRHGYTVQHYYAFRLEILCRLYDGLTAQAWARLQRELPSIKRARVLQMSVCRIELYSLQAGIELRRAAESRGGQRARFLRSCGRLAARLERERRVDGPPLAKLIHAGLAALAGKQSDAVALLEQSIHGFEHASMALHAWCARRRRAELLGDQAAVHEADAWMMRHGVTAPERWAALIAPITLERRASTTTAPQDRPWPPWRRPRAP